MSTPTPETVYYRNRRGIRVTDRFVSTRYKDEALAPVESVQVGRELLVIALVCGAALLMAAYRFRDLLYAQEQLTLAGAAALIVLIGASVAPLRIGRYAHEKTILWSSIWTVHAVRRAIAKAKQAERARDSGTLLLDDILE